MALTLLSHEGMSGITNLFNIGSSALFAYQKALSVTGQNLSNVNTPGYSRQDAVLAETLPMNDRPGQIGTGVQVTEVKRQVDAFVNQQLTLSQQQLGEFSASNDALNTIQALFSDTQSTTIGSALNDFFSALQDVATSPSDVAARTVALSKAQALVNQFHQNDTQLTDEQHSLDQSVGQAVTDINSYTTQIAQLNDQIAQAEASGQHANDLRDQRDRVLNSLSNLINVSSVEDATGQVSVFTGQGQQLVGKNISQALSVVANSSNRGFLDVEYTIGGTTSTLNAVITGGRLKGLLDARDQVIPSLQSQLNTLAQQVVTQVNTQHQAGFGLDGSTGVNFFAPSGTTAGTMAVAITNGQKIAASSTAAGVPGNNVNALALVSLQTATVAGLSGVTFNAYYQSTAASIGSQASQASQNLKAQQLLDTQLQAHRAEISGVSMDQELINMMQYQRAFQAASRIVTTADTLMQTILSLKQ